jgi:hypothetical protein
MRLSQLAGGDVDGPTMFPRIGDDEARRQFRSPLARGWPDGEAKLGDDSASADLINPHAAPEVA